MPADVPPLEVFQAEWCPHSALIRERLTELGVAFVARQVPAERPKRTELLEVTGQDGIPALVFGDGTIVTGDDATLLAAIDRRYPDAPGTAAHERAAVDHGEPSPGRTGES